jgi:O-antigen/teichoic acid export membrane protein
MLAVIIEPDVYVRSLVILFSFSLLGRSLWMWSAAAFNAFEETYFVAAFELGIRSLEVIALLMLLAYVGPDLRWIAAIHVAFWVIQGATGLALISRRHGISINLPNVGWLTVARDGIPGAAFGIAMAAFLQLPIVLFRQIEGIGDPLGHFALGFQIVSYLMSIPFVVAHASLPVFSRSAERKDGKDRTATVALTILIIVGGAGAALIAAFVAIPVVKWLFGENYLPVASIVMAGLWLLIPASLAMLFQQVSFSTALNSNLAAWASLIGVASMVALFPALLRAGGDAGALVSIGVGLAIWLTCVFVAVLRGGFFKRHAVKDAT